MRTIILCFTAVIVCGVITPASKIFAGEEWSRFRGPNGEGRATLPSAPHSWESDAYAWTVDLPGKGHSSPILAADRLFLTSGDNKTNKIHLIALDPDTGKILWDVAIAYSPRRLHSYNNAASTNPCADDERVYMVWTEADSWHIAAYSHAGKSLWRRDVNSFESQHGGAAPPVVIDGKLIVALENRASSKVLALDPKTGKTLWERPRESSSTAYGAACTIAGPDGRNALAFASESHGIYALDPADGSVLWETPGLFNKRAVASPVMVGGLIFASCGSGGGGNYVAAVRPPSQPGEKPEAVYTVRRSAPYVPTSVATDNRLFLISDSGIATCINPADGDPIWRERLDGNFFGSPVLVNDRIYCMSRYGKLFVLKAADTFEVLGTVELGEASHATPTVGPQGIYFRTESKLRYLKVAK